MLYYRQTDKERYMMDKYLNNSVTSVKAPYLGLLSCSLPYVCYVLAVLFNLPRLRSMSDYTH